MNDLWTGKTILIVDDDQVLRDQLARALQRRGLEPTTADSFETAMFLAKHSLFDMAILDLRMDGPNGLELLQALLKLQPKILAVMLTGYGSIATAVDAVKLGAVNYVQKPADADDLLAAFDRAEQKTPDGSDIQYEAPTLARLEWEHINRVMADTGGNISEAARRLGLHRRTLQRKLQSYAPND